MTIAVVYGTGSSLTAVPHRVVEMQGAEHVCCNFWYKTGVFPEWWQPSVWTCWDGTVLTEMSRTYFTENRFRGLLLHYGDAYRQRADLDAGLLLKNARQPLCHRDIKTDDWLHEAYSLHIQPHQRPDSGFIAAVVACVLATDVYVAGFDYVPPANTPMHVYGDVGDYQRERRIFSQLFPNIRDAWTQLREWHESRGGTLRNLTPLEGSAFVDVLDCVEDVG